MTGFTFPYGNKDVFVATSYKRKTESLARKILRKMLLPENPDTVAELLYWMQPAELEIKGITRKYYEISGKNFGGRGSFCDDGMTIILEV